VQSTFVAPQHSCNEIAIVPYFYKKLPVSQIKDALRELFIFLHLDVTKNLKYDRLSRRIMKDNIQNNFNCIDIGCHKGEMLNYMLKLAPMGIHFAFEPIPHLYHDLLNKYNSKASVFPYALSNSSGETTFQWVKNAPAYSGIKRRKYDIENPNIEEITVEKKLLDEVIPESLPIHFVKIDVEGAEFGVLKGARKILSAHKPTILFECGKGASDYYETNPSDLHSFLTDEIGLNIFTLDNFISNNGPMTKSDFEYSFNNGTEYYFIASQRA